MNQETPLVSVIMPCYNHEKYVADSLESIFSQTYANLEVIIADNGSTDSTGEIIQSYRDKIDRIIVMEENDIAKCEEILYASCTGKYIAMAHSDDWWEPCKIEKQVRALEERKDCGACFTWAVYTMENLNEFSSNNIFMQNNKSRQEWQRYLFLRGNCLCHPSILAERELMLESKNYMLTCPRLGDLHAWLQLLRKKNIHVLKETLVRMRRHGHNLSIENLDTHLNDMQEMAYLMEWMCMEYSDEEFASIFAPDFVKQDAHTHEELFCERFFLLLKAAQNNCFAVGAAYRMLCACFLHPKIRKVIENTYHYKRWDIAGFEQDNMIFRLIKQNIEHKEEKKKMFGELGIISDQAITLLDKTERLFAGGSMEQAERTLALIVDCAREIQAYIEKHAVNLRQCSDAIERQAAQTDRKARDGLCRDLLAYFQEIQNLLKG